LNCSPEAARGLVEEVADTRKLGSDGKALVAADVTKLTHRPMSARSPAGHHHAQRARACAPAMMVKLEAMAAGNRADFERGTRAR